MTHIRSIALKPFLYSENGYTTRPIAVHEEFDCLERLFDGLNAERFIRRAVIGDGHVSLTESAIVTGHVMHAGAIKTAKIATGTIPGTPITAEPASVAAEPELMTTQSVTTGMINAEPADTRRTAEPEADQDAVEIPQNWRTLKWFAMRSLARRVSNDPINDAAGAVAAIEAALARRAAKADLDL